MPWESGIAATGFGRFAFAGFGAGLRGAGLGRVEAGVFLLPRGRGLGGANGVLPFFSRWVPLVFVFSFPRVLMASTRFHFCC